VFIVLIKVNIATVASEAVSKAVRRVKGIKGE
jgi:hypothetical protein